MRSIVLAAAVALAIGQLVLAGDPMEPATVHARDRFEAETRSKSDQQLIDSVHQTLTDDPRVSSMKIEVDARGGIVRLTGEVETDREKATATKVAESVGGVRRVENQLTVATTVAPAPGTSPIPEVPASDAH